MIFFTETARIRKLPEQIGRNKKEIGFYSDLIRVFNNLYKNFYYLTAIRSAATFRASSTD